MQADADTKRAALGYAMALTRSLQRTANYLELEAAQVKRLLNGEEAVPEAVFLKVLDLLIAAKAAELADARASMKGSHLPEITAALEELLRRAQPRT